MMVGLIPFRAGPKKYFMSACIWVASVERSIPKLTDLVARESLFFEDYDSRLQFFAGYWLEVALVPYHVGLYKKIPGFISASKIASLPGEWKP